MTTQDPRYAGLPSTTPAAAPAAGGEPQPEPFHQIPSVTPVTGPSQAPAQPAPTPSATIPAAPAPQPAYPAPAPSAPAPHYAENVTEPLPGAGQPPAIPPAFLSPAQPAPQPAAKKPRTGLAVVSAAVIAAVLASGGTAYAVTHWGNDYAATQDGSSTLQQLGKGNESGSGSPSSNVVSPSWEAVASSVRASVVAIDVKGNQEEGEGSGVIIDAKGHILTNNHVVAVGNNIHVTLTDGTVYSAKVVGTDPTTDLAVIQIENPPADLKAATLGDSDAVKVGQGVMAIGNPLGLDNTVTSGIVSAVNRPVTTSDSDSGSYGQSGSPVVTNAIQVDAAINPGNSGGPLFDGAGKVIGINSSIASLSSGMSGSQAGSIGLGFAIPINLAKNIAGQLIASGTAKHAYLGVGLSDSTAEVNGVTREGAKVESVSDGTPAAKAGLKVGDVIVGIDGNAVSGADSATAFVRSYSVGQQANLTVVRDGKALDVPVTLAVKPDTDSSSGQGQQGQGGQGRQGQGGQGQQGQGQGEDPFDPFGFFGNGQ